MTKRREQVAVHGLACADILVPKAGIDMEKWAIVACDQYTSEPEYWTRVAQTVGSAPSTLHMIYPEVYLEEENPGKRIEAINRTMAQYLDDGLFDCYPNAFFLIERKTAADKEGRWGLLACLDLDEYDYSVDSTSLIRATEGTILDRIPPRKAIRKHAALEVPHILVLINDAARSVIEPLAAKRETLRHIYDTPLMEGGGSVSAWLVDSEADRGEVFGAIETLHSALDPANPLLFAMGDGNHSLATAKSCWEDIKATLPEGERAAHPARFALVEIENIHDPALEFEPIHRTLFGLSQESFERSLAGVCTSFRKEAVRSLEEINDLIDCGDGEQRFGYSDAHGYWVYTLIGADHSIAAGSLQSVIDALLKANTCTVDYIHGKEVTIKLGQKSGNIALILPEVSKATFFDTIVHDRALPRKTFSMGEAQEKRFYIEARKIRI
jgi:hypothetical protein